jgi:transcriptional regulator with XRE-family HTH domain
MAKRKPSYAAKLSPNEIGSRLTALGAKYTQKELAARLGVSVRTLNYYQSGHNLPKQKQTYEKINRLYKKEAPAIEPERIQRKQTHRETTSKTQTDIKRRWISREIHEIIDDQKLHGSKKLEILMDLEDAGYKGIYFGFFYSDTGEYFFVPREWSPGDPLPKFLSIVGVGQDNYPKGMKSLRKQSKAKAAKAKAAKAADDEDLLIESNQFIMAKRINIAGLPGIKKADPDGQMDIARERYFTTKYDRPYTISKFLGIIIPEE